MDDQSRRARLRSFVFGGIVGAAGTVAAVRRVRRSRRPFNAPAGLAAFEDAPCFLELVEREAQSFRGRGDDAPSRG